MYFGQDIPCGLCEHLFLALASSYSRSASVKNSRICFLHTLRPRFPGQAFPAHRTHSAVTLEFYEEQVLPQNQGCTQVGGSGASQSLRGCVVENDPPKSITSMGYYPAEGKSSLAKRRSPSLYLYFSLFDNHAISVAFLLGDNDSNHQET